MIKRKSYWKQGNQWQNSDGEGEEQKEKQEDDIDPSYESKHSNSDMNM